MSTPQHPAMKAKPSIAIGDGGVPQRGLATDVALMVLGFTLVVLVCRLVLALPQLWGAL